MTSNAIQFGLPLAIFFGAVGWVCVAIFLKVRRIEDGAFVPGLGLVVIAYLLQLLPDSDLWIVHAVVFAAGVMGLALIERLWSRHSKRSQPEPIRLGRLI